MAKSQATIDQAIWIEQARKLLGPSPVRLHHVPGWFSKAIRKAYGRSRPTTPAGEAMQGLLRHHWTERWLDHWGSTRHCAQVAFVAEPYGITEQEVALIATIASDLGCDWRLCSNSWWYPGSTLRILFYPKAAS